MEKFELYAMIIFGALCLITVVSFALTAACGCGKAIRIVFIVYDALVLVVCILAALIWLGMIKSPDFEALKTTYVPLASFVVAILSSAELTSLAAKKRSANRVAYQPIEVEKVDYVLPCNVRKADTRLHGDYKIVK